MFNYKSFLDFIEVTFRYLLYFIFCILTVIYFFFPELWDIILLIAVQKKSSIFNYYKQKLSNSIIEPKNYNKIAAAAILASVILFVYSLFFR